MARFIRVSSIPYKEKSGIRGSLDNVSIRKSSTILKAPIEF